MHYFEIIDVLQDVLCYFVSIFASKYDEIMKIRIYVFLIAALAFLCQCKENKTAVEGGSDYPSGKTFVSIDSCMSYMMSDPAKAHRMLDSLRDARLMTKERCDYYHAMVIYSGEKNLDSALVICDRLLDNGKFGDDDYLEEEICVLASGITYECARHIETLRYAKRGIAICHGNENMRGDEATLMGRMGTAEQIMGREKEARETYEKAYELLKENNSFADFVALISLKKKQASLCQDAKDYESVIKISNEILGEVEHFDKDPSFIKQRPESMAEHGDATHDFADFYQCQMYERIARAYYSRIMDGASADRQADTDSVKMYMERWSKTKASQSPTSVAAVIRILLFVGRRAEFDRAKEAIDDLYRNDSISEEYMDYLTVMAEDAASGNNLKSSNAYLRRVLALGDSLRKQDMTRKLSEQMSINMVQEYQLESQDAENSLALHKIINILLSIILLIVVASGIAIALFYRRNKRNEQIIEMAQQDLNVKNEEIQELVQQLDETKAERVAHNNKVLYESIEKVMSKESLYLNSELDIKMLAEAVNSSRSQVSACINSIAGKPFRQWIADYRLSLFVKMLKENPDISIDVLMMRCGYKEQSTFRRQFKAAYGMTAGEYRSTLRAEEKNNSTFASST